MAEHEIIYDTAAPSFSAKRSGHSATLLLDGSVLVIGGHADDDETDGPNAFDTTEIYDPQVGTFSPGPKLSTKRNSHAASLLPDGSVLVAGGLDENENTLNTTEIYSPTTKSFAPGPSLSTKRYGHSASHLLDGVLVVGGMDENNNKLNTTEFYSTSTKSFSPGPSLATKRTHHTTSSLPNGSVLVAGGQDEDWGGLNTTEIYSPSTKCFSLGPPLSTERQYHSASPLPDGSVLMAGGMSFGSPVNTTEIYSPPTKSFSPGPPLSAERHCHSASLLPDGSLLMAGGAFDKYWHLHCNNEIYCQPDVVYTVGQNVWYVRGGVEPKHATIIKVHHDDATPYYTIKIDGDLVGERETEGCSLRPRRTAAQRAGVRAAAEALHLIREEAAAAKLTREAKRAEATAAAAAAARRSKQQQPPGIPFPEGTPTDWRETPLRCTVVSGCTFREVDNSEAAHPEVTREERYHTGGIRRQFLPYPFDDGQPREYWSCCDSKGSHAGCKSKVVVVRAAGRHSASGSEIAAAKSTATKAARANQECATHPPAPAPWRARWDAAQERVFYHNPATNESCWTLAEVVEHISAVEEAAVQKWLSVIGFPEADARAALKAAGGDQNRAAANLAAAALGRPAPAEPRSAGGDTLQEERRIGAISTVALRIRGAQDANSSFKGGGYLRSGCNSIAHLGEVVDAAGCTKMQVNQAFVNAVLDTDDAAAHGVSTQLLDSVKVKVLEVKQSYLAECRWNHPGGARGRYVYDSRKVKANYRSSWTKLVALSAGSGATSSGGGVLGNVTAIKKALNISLPADQMLNVVIEANAKVGIAGAGTVIQQIAELCRILGLPQ